MLYSTFSKRKLAKKKKNEKLFTKYISGWFSMAAMDDSGQPNIPNDFLCPITSEIMRRPVICADGHSYEEAAILEWFKRSNRSPKTGLELQSKVLIPNIALRNAIEEFIITSAAGGQIAKIDAKVDGQIAKVDEQVEEKQLLPVTEYITLVGKNYAKSTSQNVSRTPVHLICAIDVSGSMDELCLLGKEDNGFSRLDLVKHSLRTIAASMSNADRITLIKFSDDAQRLYTGAASQQLSECINNLHTEGSTNIWAALKTACDIALLVSKQINTSVLLLTDGQPNGHLDTNGIIRAYQANPQYHGIPITSVGYGYDIDHKLLSFLTEQSSGRYLFIPDISMVGTIFVHYLANVFAADYSSADLRMPLKLNHFHLTSTVSDAIARAPTADEVASIAYLSFATFVQYITMLAAENLSNLEELIKIQCTKFAEYPTIVNDLLSEDLHAGQISKSILPANYKRWGRFYLAMLSNAHARQECYNFKDSSTQAYGGPVFRSLVAAFDKIYNELPAPKPSRATRHTTYVNTMSSLNDSGNGCFSGNAVARVVQFDTQDETYNPSVRTNVSALKKGDYVETGIPYQYAKVLCVVRQNAPNIDVCHVDDFYITPWHPIYNSSEKKWEFPAEAKDALHTKNPHSYIYNLVLESTHQVLLNDTIVITLGHGIQDNPVTKHPYFGTNAVIEDLANLPGYDEGFVDLTSAGVSFTRESNRSSQALVTGMQLTV